MKKKKNSIADKWCIIVLCAPAVIHLLIFWLGVQVETIRMTFTEYETGKIGFENFKWVIKQFIAGFDTGLGLAVVNTMRFFIVGILLRPITMFFAYLVFRKVPGHGYIRTFLFLPGAIGGIMLAMLYIKLMESTGPVMQFIQNITGREEPIFFMVTNGMEYVQINDVLFSVGAQIMIWIGTMSRIPDDLIEYGKLEGIGPFREFATVVLPLIWPTFVTMITLELIGIFGASGSVLVLTNGAYGTNTLNFWMYSMVQQGLSSEYNRVSALGLMLTIATLPLVIVGRKFMNRFGGEVEY